MVATTTPSRFRWQVGVATGVWLLVSVGLTWKAPTPGSPDEAANGFFIRQFAKTNELTAASYKLSATELSYWHPRSLRVDGDTLKPGSFLGLVLVGGWVDQAFGGSAHLVLTPLVALGGLVALFMILRRFWSPGWSLLGASLVALHPVWWQFQTLPLYHNGLFASLLIVAGWRLMVLWEYHRISNAVWFGLAYGATLWFRPVEVIWTAPLIAIVLLAQRQWKYLLIAAGLTALIQLPWLMIGWQLYGPSLGAGYASAQISGEVTTAAETFSPLSKILRPPGGWSWNWLHSFWDYFVLVVPAWSMATAITLWFYLRRISNLKLKVLKISLVSLGLAIPFIFYGTWNLYPLETPQNVGSLASYARYWLPLYVPMVVGVLWVLKRMTDFRWRVVVIIGLFISQAATIVWHPNAGVLDRLAGNRRVEEQRRLVLQQTPIDSAIVAGHMDKILFPDRIVTFDLPKNETEWVGFVSVLFTRPVFMYVTPRQYDQTKLNAQLEGLGFQVGERYPVAGDELWALKRL